MRALAGGRSVDSPVLRKRQWVLTPQAFEKLLASLDASRDRAGEKYEQLRSRLVKFFEWRGCPSPDDQADEALNRVTRKLEEGEQVHDLYRYTAGIARRLVLEMFKQQEKAHVALRHLSALQEVTADVHADRRDDCLERSLRRLPRESRMLILEYYQVDCCARIEHRKALAEQLGIPVNALRIRVHRLRTRLEKQVGECMRQSSTR
jgi:DNA-directed RNA polymerase specialized sigma24 family protein